MSKSPPPCCATPPGGADDAGERALVRVRAAMHALIGEPLTVGQLAREAGVGRYRLIRAFRRRYGIPPSGYLRTLRLEAAKRRPAAGETPTDAAAATGFADQAHLTRLFRRAYGLTPGAYRRAVAAP